MGVQYGHHGRGANRPHAIYPHGTGSKVRTKAYSASPSLPSAAPNHPNYFERDDVAAGRRGPGEACRCPAPKVALSVRPMQLGGRRGFQWCRRAAQAHGLPLPQSQPRPLPWPRADTPSSHRPPPLPPPSPPEYMYSATRSHLPQQPYPHHLLPPPAAPPSARSQLRLIVLLLPSPCSPRPAPACAPPAAPP